MVPEITIAGAGLAGSLLALYLAKAGYRVAVYERRPDLRYQQVDTGRSINLAISKRGLQALAEVGLTDKVQPLLVPMYGRKIHSLTGEIRYLAYGLTEQQHQNAISRADLNKMLLDALDEYPNVNVYFQHKIETVDFANRQMSVVNQQQQQLTVNFSWLLGADGAASAVRRSMAEQELVTATIQDLGHSYKELVIPARLGHHLATNYLHIWPRCNFMLIALPNSDGSFTCTLFMPNDASQGEMHFQMLRKSEAIETFFHSHFSDAVDLFPDLIQQFEQHPTSYLSSLQCKPWYYQDKALLLGDAAHALVPFLGEGMNCAFEDCSQLVMLLQANNGDRHAVARAFYQQRQPNTDAVMAMALDNYHEMRDHVANQQFLTAKKVEAELMRRYPGEYISQYSLVAFHQVSYAYAQTCGRLQKQLINKIANDTLDNNNFLWQHWEQAINDYLAQVQELEY